MWEIYACTERSVVRWQFLDVGFGMREEKRRESIHLCRGARRVACIIVANIVVVIEVLVND